MQTTIHNQAAGEFDPHSSTRLTLVDSPSARVAGWSAWQGRVVDRPSQPRVQHGVTTGDKTHRWFKFPLYDVGGLHGAAYLREELLSLDGVRGVIVNVPDRLVQVSYDPALADAQDIVRQVRLAGFAVSTAEAQFAIRRPCCPCCVAHAEDVLKQTRGVVAASLSGVRQVARVEYLPSTISPERLAAVISAAGLTILVP